MIIRRLIIVILLIDFFSLCLELNKINDETNNTNSSPLLYSFIDSASLAPIETTTVGTSFIKVTFYSSINDNTIRKLKAFPKSLQLISETESESNNRRSTFTIVESTTGT